MNILDKITDTQIARFHSNIHKPVPVHFPVEESCWGWQKALGTGGYGQFNIMVDGKQHNLRAHRLAWVLDRGREIPEGKIVMHQCDNRLCCNPGHIKLGTTEENIQDMVNKNRQAKGVINGKSKYTEEQVRQVKHEFSHLTALKTAFLTGVAVSSIYYMRGRRAGWGHI